MQFSSIFWRDRYDFTAPEDVWPILRTLVEERKKREIDPTLNVLREILRETMIEQLTSWYDDVKRLEMESLASFLALGSKNKKLLEAKDRLVSLASPRSAQEDR